MKAIQAYQAEDGSLYQDPRLCQLHELKNRAESLYCDDPIRDSTEITFENYKSWVSSNRDAAIAVLQLDTLISRYT